MGDISIQVAWKELRLEEVSNGVMWIEIRSKEEAWGPPVGRDGGNEEEPAGKMGEKEPVS